MAIDRLLRANRQVLIAPVIDGPNGPLIVSATGTVTPLATPAAAVINSWVSVLQTTNAAAHNGGNISCSLLDDLSLGLADSETDTELTICSIGNEATPTFYNVDAEFTALRDRNQADTGVFNLATQLLNAAGVRYVAIDRIGKSSSAAVVVGDVISIYELNTDHPVDVKEDRGNLKIQQSPTATGIVNVLYTLAA